MGTRPEQPEAERPRVEHRYRLVDVFSARPLAGNPLAVFLEGDRVADDAKQLVAGELRLSETVFVGARSERAPGAAGARRAAMRIFTPTSELPFAGHPTLGSAHVLALDGGLALGEEERWELAQAAGPVAVTVRRTGARTSFARLVLERPPELGPPAPPLERIAPVLGLRTAELEDAAFASLGVRYLIVRVRDRASLRGLALDPAAWRATLAEAWTPHVAVHCFLSDAEAETRVFLPAAGIPEDPATGAAAAALGALLAHRLGEGELALDLRQGEGLGRPSRLRVEAQARGGRVRSVAVGGDVTTVGHGVLELDEVDRSRAAQPSPSP